MRRSLLLVAALLLPGAAVAQSPEVIEGRFTLSLFQPHCARAPCPPSWTVEQAGRRLTAHALRFDPATPASVQEAIRRQPPRSLIQIEGRATVVEREATILARSHRILTRR